jgi:hypothetical protein
VEDGRRVANVGKGTSLTHFTTLCGIRTGLSEENKFITVQKA